MDSNAIDEHFEGHRAKSTAWSQTLDDQICTIDRIQNDLSRDNIISEQTGVDVALTQVEWTSANNNRVASVHITNGRRDLGNAWTDFIDR
jgi:hypothetical protein